MKYYIMGYFNTARGQVKAVLGTDKNFYVAANHVGFKTKEEALRYYNEVKNELKQKPVHVFVEGPRKGRYSVKTGRRLS